MEKVVHRAPRTASSDGGGRYLTVEEVAEHLRCSPRTIHELTRMGLIPHRKLPTQRRCLFLPAELEAWADGAALERVDLAGGGRAVRVTTLSHP